MENGEAEVEVQMHARPRRRCEAEVDLIGGECLGTMICTSASVPPPLL